MSGMNLRLIEQPGYNDIKNSAINFENYSDVKLMR